jgi:hypothetical protein
MREVVARAEWSTQKTSVLIVGAGPTGLALACDLRSVTSGVNCTQNQRFEFPYDVVSASSPDPVEDATVLGPIKAKPCGWPRRRGQP